MEELHETTHVHGVVVRRKGLSIYIFRQLGVELSMSKRAYRIYRVCIYNILLGDTVGLRTEALVPMLWLLRDVVAVATGLIFSSWCNRCCS